MDGVLNKYLRHKIKILNTVCRTTSNMRNTIIRIIFCKKKTLLLKFIISKLYQLAFRIGRFFINSKIKTTSNLFVFFV